MQTDAFALPPPFGAKLYSLGSIFYFKIHIHAKMFEGIFAGFIKLCRQEDIWSIWTKLINVSNQKYILCNPQQLGTTRLRYHMNVDF